MPPERHDRCRLVSRKRYRSKHLLQLDLIRCRKAAADQIPAANYGHLEVPRPKQDVVPIDIVPDHIPEQHTASQMQNPYLDNSHTIEVAMKNITVRISNDADPVLLTRTFRLLQELSC